MTTYNGTVLASSLYIRAAAAVSGAPLGQLKGADKITAEILVDGFTSDGKPCKWWKLKTIMRGLVSIPLPAPDCYSCAGATGGYIRTDSIIEDPPPAGAFTVEVWDDGVLQTSKQVDDLSVLGFLDGDETLNYQHP